MKSLLNRVAGVFLVAGTLMLGGCEMGNEPEASQNSKKQEKTHNGQSLETIAIAADIAPCPSDYCTMWVGTAKCKDRTCGQYRGELSNRTCFHYYRSGSDCAVQSTIQTQYRCSQLCYVLP